MRPNPKPIVLVSLISCFFATAIARAEVPVRTNVVLVMADDQGWGDTGYNGHPELKTPHLDALAAAGLRLNRFYAAHFNCSPTRASVMTGRHPHRMGTFSPGSPIRAGVDRREGAPVRGLRDRPLRQVAPERQERRQEYQDAAGPRDPRR